MTVAPMLEAVDAMSEETVALCQALVRTNTVNRYSGDASWGNEGAGQAVIEPLLRQIGARIEKFDCPPDIYERFGVRGPQGRDFRDRPNLVAELDLGGAGPRVVLQAHMDTVGVEGMTVEPFSGEIRDGKIWGRGASDCGGGIAATVTVLRALARLRDRLRGSVVFQSVVEEESNGGGAGTLACCARGLKADFAVVTDGPGVSIGRGYSGVLTVEVAVSGVSGHAARPDAVSAIEKALVVKRGIDRFKAERESSSDKATVSLGVFRGGTHPAVVAGDAVMSLNMSYPMADARSAEEAGLGFGGRQVMEHFERRVREQEQDDAWLSAHPARCTWVKDLIPFELGEDHELVAGLAAQYQEIFGERPTVYVSPSWSDACYLPRFCGIPAVVFGAGTPGKSHSGDEYAEIDRILGCSRVLGAFLYRRLAR